MVSQQYSYKYPGNIISWFFLAKRHEFVRALLKGNRNLDVACGLFKITKDSIGIDIKAWKRPDVVGSVFELSQTFRPDSFESVTLLEVIEHYDSESQGKMLSQIRKVLKPGGQLIVAMPNISPFWGLPYRIIWYFWERTIQKEYFHEHIGMIPRAQLLALLHRNGFRVVGFHRVALLDLIVECENAK